MLAYTFKRAEALGKYQTQLVDEMGLEELQYWIAHDMLKDDEFKKKIQLSIQKKMTSEQEADAIKTLLNMIIR